MDINSLMLFLIPRANQWIEQQRDLHQPFGRAITSEEAQILTPYYRKSTLDKCRIKIVPRIDNPPFYMDLAASGITGLINFQDMAGITFDNTILVSKIYLESQPFISLLFHELVHVAQYSILGVNNFTQRYVMGWAQNGFSYSSIPLERQAYELQALFNQSSKNYFSVEDILMEKLSRN